MNKVGFKRHAVEQVLLAEESLWPMQGRQATLAMLRSQLSIAPAIRQGPSRATPARPRKAHTKVGAPRPTRRTVWLGLGAK
jgi:hypothetical protein